MASSICFGLGLDEKINVGIDEAISTDAGELDGTDTRLDDGEVDELVGLRLVVELPPPKTALLKLFPLDCCLSMTDSPMETPIAITTTLIATFSQNLVDFHHSNFETFSLTVSSPTSSLFLEPSQKDRSFWNLPDP